MFRLLDLLSVSVVLSLSIATAARCQEPSLADTIDFVERARDWARFEWTVQYPGDDFLTECSQQGGFLRSQNSKSDWSYSVLQMCQSPDAPRGRSRFSTKFHEFGIPLDRLNVITTTSTLDPIAYPRGATVSGALPKYVVYLSCIPGLCVKRTVDDRNAEGGSASGYEFTDGLSIEVNTNEEAERLSRGLSWLIRLSGGIERKPPF